MALVGNHESQKHCDNIGKFHWKIGKYCQKNRKQSFKKYKAFN